MKKNLIFLTSFLLTVFLAGCGVKNGSFEPQYKSEPCEINVTDGMVLQTIQENVTYVQNVKDGDWVKEDSEVTDWKIENLDLLHTSWGVKAEEAALIYPDVDDYFKEKRATLWVYFAEGSNEYTSEIKTDEDGTPILDVSFDMTGYGFFDSNGNQFLFEDVKFSGCELYEDGSTKLKVNFGGEEGRICISVDAQKGTRKDFLAACSNTYIESVDFENIPTFDVSSNCNSNGIWDTKISNTKYGENISPDLSWDEVEGAASYVVIMIDGEWLHMDVFTQETSLAEGAYANGSRGEQYVGPYPPSGTHTYSVFVFALKNEPDNVYLGFDGGGNNINKIYKGLDTDIDGNTGNVLSYARLDGNYTHKD